MLSILQSQFSEKGFKKAENSKQNVVLLLFLFTLQTNTGQKREKERKKGECVCGWGGGVLNFPWGIGPVSWKWVI